MDRDDEILEARFAGASVPAIAKRYGCSLEDVEAVIDRRLDYDVDNEMRLKAIKLDIARLEALMEPFFERATKSLDVPAGTLCVKILERRSLLLGLDSPIRVDIAAMQAAEKPSGYEKMRATINAFMERLSPTQKAVRKRLEQLSPEKALELLGSPESNGGDGAVDSP